jgi:hypothetical protein
MMDYEVSAGFLGSGTMHKAVTKDEGSALWINQKIELSIQNENVDILINKADGKILKMIRNGQEQQIPDDKLEVISQDYTEIDVKAGHFKAIHIVAKTKQVSKMEIWANPRDTVMDGSLKNIIATGMVDLTMELSSFKHGQ